MMPDLCSLKFVLGIVWFPSLLHNETNSTTNYIDFIAYLAIGCWTSLLRGFLRFVLRGIFARVLVSKLSTANLTSLKSIWFFKHTCVRLLRTCITRL
jgi:hypothetical protein